MKKLILLIVSLSCIYLHAEFEKVHYKDFLKIHGKLEVFANWKNEDIRRCEFPTGKIKTNYKKLYITILYTTRNDEIENVEKQHCYFSFDSQDLTKENFLKNVKEIENIYHIVWYGLLDEQESSSYWGCIVS